MVRRSLARAALLGSVVLGTTAALGAPALAATGSEDPVPTPVEVTDIAPEPAPDQPGVAPEEPVAIQAVVGDGVEVTVMARNIYLGSDVGKALELLPDLGAAGQFMWDEVQLTDFTARVPKLAAEAAATKPAVIGLQEATTWNCTNSFFGGSVTVYDFAQQFIEATQDTDTPYVIASANGTDAYNPGYSIGPIPRLTMVNDPETFQPLFGSDTAACGFQLADALLVRADLADQVTVAGTVEFDTAHAIIPWLFEVDRGFAWADIDIEGVPVRFVTTHLESMWTQDAQNAGAEQARELVEDLASTEIPLVVIGDINNDPRDPRPFGGANPAGQPEAGEVCEEQVPNPTAETALAQCNAYWTLIQSGYTDVGPDADDPQYYTWGSNALLAGPDARRVEAGLELGNTAGWTDRLDYIVVKNGIEVISSEVIGKAWPVGEDNWECSGEPQVQNTEEMSALLAAAGVGEAVTGEGICFPSDHAGIVTTLSIAPPVEGAAAPVLDSNESWFNKQLAALIGIFVVLVGFVVLVVWLIVKLVKKIFGRGKGTPPAGAAPAGSSA